MDQSVVIVGGGFGGVGCAHLLAHHGVEVTLLDKNDYHQFQPLLYQLATAQIGLPDLARPLRGIFAKSDSVRVVTGEVTAIDPTAHTVELADGTGFSGDALVLAAGAQPNFFGVPGAAEHAFPLYSVEDAERVRSRLLGALDAVDSEPELVDRGGLTIVIVGAGPTGVETAGAFAETIRDIVPGAYENLPVEKARIVLVDHSDVVLGAFSERAQHYAAERLEADGVELRLGVGVSEVANGHVVLSDGSTITTRTVIWAGGEKACDLVGRSGLPTGRGGRVDVEADLGVAGFPGVYVVGDAANVPGPDGDTLPQLGSVALQSGRWAAQNILAVAAGEPSKPFDYHDKGIMAMIGRNAAVAELGTKRHEIDGPFAYAAWLGVHASLLEGTRQKLSALMTWGWDYASKRRPRALADRPDASVIDWDDD